MALYRMKTGMSIPAVIYAGAIANWRMIPSTELMELGETSVLDDEWLGRIAYAERAHSGSVPVSDAVFVSKFPKRTRLSPMSSRGLERYWDVSLVARRLPVCPSIGILPSYTSILT
jgi:hypothetical protein